MQALPIDNKQQQNNNKMGAEASAEAGAEVFAEAIGDMCFGLPPGTGMLLRAPIHIAKAAATAKPPIHLHIGGGAAVTAAAAAGAASRARPGVALNFGRPRAITRRPHRRDHASPRSMTLLVRGARASPTVNQAE